MDDDLNLEQVPMFGSISNFGSMCCSPSFMLLLLVIAVVGVIYYQNRGNLKLSLLGKQIMFFGKTRR
jgi:hypothetical protein